MSDSVVRTVSGNVMRAAGAAFEEIPPQLRGAAIEPADPAYRNFRSTFFRSGSPGLVLRPADKEQVAAAVVYAREHVHLPISVRSGGHGISGRSTNHGGIVIDLSRMAGIEITDVAARKVRVQPGATWQGVSEVLAPRGWTIPSGDFGGVGVGGLATAGGVGLLARDFGLTIDHLRSVEMVLADGSIVRADEVENSELFWAVRGAGANFGVVTSFDFEARTVGDLGYAQVLFDAGDTAGFLERWGRVIEASPRDLTCFLMMSPGSRGRPTLAMARAVVNSSDKATIGARLAPLLEIAPVLQQRVEIVPSASIFEGGAGGPQFGQGEPASRSGSLRHITKEFADGAARLLRSGATSLVKVMSMGGAISDVAPDGTAFASRTANFEFIAAGSDQEGLNTSWGILERHFEGEYICFDADDRPERSLRAYPPQTFARLRHLKRSLDPANLFRDNVNVTPQA